MQGINLFPCVYGSRMINVYICLLLKLLFIFIFYWIKIGNRVVKSHYFYQRAEISRNIWSLCVRYHQYFIIILKCLNQWICFEFLQVLERLPKLIPHILHLFTLQIEICTFRYLKRKQNRWRHLFIFCCVRNLLWSHDYRQWVCKKSFSISEKFLVISFIVVFIRDLIISHDDPLMS